MKSNITGRSRRGGLPKPFQEKEENKIKNKVLQVIFERRIIRKYSEKPVQQEDPRLY